MNEREKGPLDVYRDAANEYRTPNEGCAIILALMFCGAIWGLCHWFGAFGL